MPFGANDEVVAPRNSGFGGAVGDRPIGTTPATGRRAQDIGDAILAGLQNSATGLALRGKVASVEMGPDAPWYQRLASGGAGMVADLPLSVAAAVPAAPGGPIAMGAAGFAAPMALRDALIEAYNNDHALSWSGAWEIGKQALKGGVKGAVIGGATMGAGKLAAPLVAPTAGRAVMAGSMTPGAARGAVDAATLGAELATMTTTAAALEGHLPTAQDFMDNAILLGGLKGVVAGAKAVATAKQLRNIYAETGKTPDAVLGDAARDPMLAKELAAKPDELPAQYAPLALEQRIEAALANDNRVETIRQNMAADKEPRPLSPTDKTAVAWEYVVGVEELKAVVRQVSAETQAEIQAQRRGVQPNAATAADALRMVASGEVVEHQIGTAGNAAQIMAAAMLLKDAARSVMNERAKLAELTEAEMSPVHKLGLYAALERLAMVNAEFAGLRAEAGRSLQILGRVKRDPAFLGEANTLLALNERKGSFQDLLQKIDSLKDPAQLTTFADGYVKATTTEKVLEAWKAAILSGPQTHLANIMGNTSKWMLDIPETAIAATFTAAQRKLAGDPLTMAQFKARALAPLYGLQFGAMDALTVAKEVALGKGESLEKADVYRTAIEGKKGEVIRLPFKALQVQDALFRTLAERAEAHIMAVDRAVKEGLHPDSKEFREAVVKYTAEPETGLSEKAALEAVTRIEQAGAEAVFSQRLGPRMETLQRAMAGHWSQLIIPFVRTPTNLVSWAIQHVPGMNLMSGRWREDFAAGGERQAKAVARVTIGAGLATAAYVLASDGLLTGGGNFDPEQRRTKTAAGWQPYSVKVGDAYYSYQRMEPVAKVLGIAADLIELQQAATDEQDKAKIATMLVLMFGNATVSTTYLSGLSNAIGAVTDPARKGENFMEQYASSLVPKIVGQSVAVADPYKREVDGVMDAIQSQIPFLREKLVMKRDAWGEPQKNDRWFEVMPVAKSDISEDKVKTEAVRLQIAIADAPKFVTERGPFNPKDKRVELNAEQRDIFREVAGKNAMTILGPIVNAPDWANIPDFAKAEVYKKVIEGTRKQGQYAALPPDDAARVKLRQDIVDRVIRETEKVNK